MSILIDLGVTYKRTLGIDPARNFFDKHDIPHGLISRVLAADSQRRLTEWEECAMRMELTRHRDATRGSGAMHQPPLQGKKRSK